MYRAGIVGVGQIAFSIDYDLNRKFIWSHAKAYRLHDQIEFVAATDIKNINDKFEKDYPEVDFFNNYIKMFECHSLDIVSICTPTPTHLEVVKNIINFPSLKAIFIEKPVGQNYLESTEIDKICKSNNVILCSNYMRRWDDKYTHLNSLIKSNYLGKLQTIIATGNTSLLTSACHLIDLMLMYGNEIEWVAGDLQEDYIRIIDGIEDHGGTAMVKFKNGACGFLKAVSKIETNNLFCLELFFEDGKIKIDEPFIKDDQSVIEEFQFMPRGDDRYKSLFKINKNLAIKKNERMLDAISDLISCIETGGTPKSSGSNAIEVHKFIESIKNSFSESNIINYESK